jgi:hypothetical protein
MIRYPTIAFDKITYSNLWQNCQKESKVKKSAK